MGKHEKLRRSGQAEIGEGNLQTPSPPAYLYRKECIGTFAARSLSEQIKTRIGADKSFWVRLQNYYGFFCLTNTCSVLPKKYSSKKYSSTLDQKHYSRELRDNHYSKDIHQEHYNSNVCSNENYSKLKSYAHFSYHFLLILVSEQVQFISIDRNRQR